MSGNSETFVTLLPVETFDTPQALTEFIVSRCSSAAKSQTTLLYYGVARHFDKDQLVAVLEEDGDETWLFADLDENQWIPSMTQKWPAVSWIEREMAEKSHHKISGHPDLQPILHPQESLPRPKAAGAGAFCLPLGPVRADVTESGFFLFETVGEQIVQLQPQLFYKHRNIEELALGQSVPDGLLLAERISGTACASHSLAYTRAVEQALEIEVSPRIETERLFFTELERLYNHAGDMSQIASACGMTVGQAQLARVKEEILRLAGDLTGSRYLHGAIRPFQGTNIQWDAWSAEIEKRIRVAHQRVEKFVKLLLRTPTFVDRLVGTGIVTKDWTRQLGIVGPVARACGVATDARLRNLDLRKLGYEICVSARAVGDARDRFEIRVSEWRVSVTVVLNLLGRLATTLSESLKLSRTYGEAHVSDDGHNRWGVGVTEGPRGRIAHVVCLRNGRIEHCGIRSASAWNWPVFGLATANGNIQTDFPIIDASFGLSYAGLDR